jgi:tetratricopeptide (TPR) repeat protein
MDKKEIEDLLNHAKECYSSGKYEEALEAWRKVIEQDSDNKQAQEGVRMAEVISKPWLPEETASSEETLEVSEESGAEPTTSNQEQTTEEDQAAEETQTTVAVETAETDSADETPEAMQRASTDERVHAMIMEAEGLIKEKRYVEAIDKLSEAWSLDEMNLAVQDLMNIARSLLEMDNNKIKEKLTAATGHFEKKEFEAAEDIFKEIVSINPAHMEALTYLEKIDQEKKNSETDKAPTSYVDEGAFEQEESIAGGPEVTASGEGAGEIGEEKAEQGAEEWTEEKVETFSTEQAQEDIQETVAAPVARKKGSYTWILYPVLAVLVLAAGIYFSRNFIFGFFPDSSGSKTDSMSGDSKAVVTIPIPSIAQQPESGEPEAETLVTDESSVSKALESELGQTEEASIDVTLTASEIKARFRELIKEGKALSASGQPFEAQEKFKEAMLLNPLSIEAKKLHADASQVLAELRQKDEKMNNALQLFEEEQYEEALKLFYRLPGSNKDPIQRYILNSWYNLGVLHLMNNSVVEAKKCFEEVLLLNPYDQNAQQEMKFTEWYTSHRVDESFGNHVKALTYRKITD